MMPANAALQTLNDGASRPQPRKRRRSQRGGFGACTSGVGGLGDRRGMRTAQSRVAGGWGLVALRASPSSPPPSPPSSPTPPGPTVCGEKSDPGPADTPYGPSYGPYHIIRAFTRDVVYAEMRRWCGRHQRQWTACPSGHTACMRELLPLLSSRCLSRLKWAIGVPCCDT